MHRSSLFLCVALTLGGCRCSRPATNLTEKDTAPVELREGRLEAPDSQWSLAVPEGWLRVIAETRARLKPEVEVWLLAPGPKAHLTVVCRQDLGRPPEELEAMLVARSRTAGRAFKLTKLEPIEGPWLDGTIAVFETGAGEAGLRHVLGHYGLGRTTCEVQAWAPQAEQAVFAELEALVRSFRPKDEPTLQVLVRVARLMRSPPLQLRRNELLDAGVPEEQVAMALVADGLPRIAGALLVERFALRLALLMRVDDATCGAIVRQWDEARPEDWLGRLTEAEGNRWAAISEAALTAATQPRGPPTDKEEIKRLELRLAGDDPDLAQALMVLKRITNHPPELVCAAERQRLTAAMAWPEAERDQLLRAWVSEP